MASVEGLRRTGEYIKNVASRSVGIWYYSGFGKENKIRKEIGQSTSTGPLERVLVTLDKTLFPATDLSVREDKPSDANIPDIRSKFIKGAKLLGAIGIDLSTLVTPIAVSIATKDSLPLLGITGKLLCNAVVQVSSDIVDARAFRKKDSPKANSGTYALLEEIHNESYDPELKSGVVRDSQGKVVAVVSKEEVCARTGGSCMELILPKREGEERWLEGAHVTEKDVIVNISSEKTSTAPPPKIEDLMEDLKKYFSQKDSPSV